MSIFFLIEITFNENRKRAFGLGNCLHRDNFGSLSHPFTHTHTDVPSSLEDIIFLVTYLNQNHNHYFPSLF